MTGQDGMYHIKIVWNDGRVSGALVERHDLEGLDYDTWINNTFIAAARPHWARLGDLCFYTQNVQSIELIETLFNQEG